MSKVINLCENERGKFIGEILERLFEKGKVLKKEVKFEKEKKEVYELTCNCSRYYSEEPERIFCKTCMEFMKVRKASLDFIYSERGDNEVLPYYLNAYLPGYFPYFNITGYFEDSIVLFDDVYKLGEILRRSKNSKVVYIGRCKNCKMVDERIKIVFLFHTSIFEDMEIDGLLVRWGEGILRRVYGLEIKEEGKEKGIVLSVTNFFLSKSLERIKDLDFFGAGQILINTLLPFLEDISRVEYQGGELKEAIKSLQGFFDFLLGKREKIRVFEYKEEDISIYKKIKKTIEDIERLKGKLRGKKIVYIRPPEDIFEEFERLRRYIERKIGMEVKIVEELPKKKKVKDVGIYME